MIVEKPQKLETGEEILISAEITNPSSGTDMPERLWFRVSSRFQDGVTERSDSFLLAMLPVAMALGEELEIKGTVSSRLVFGLRDYQQILHTWWPKHFSVIDVKYSETFDGANRQRPKAVGATFSGGVDSFFTLHRHRGSNEVLPEYRLTHCLMIDGFDNDVDLGHTGLFKALCDVYEPMLSDQGIQLVVVQTNIQKFRLAAMARSNLHFTFVLPLVSAAMVLGDLFARFYIPASYQYRNLTPDGSHPMLDHLLSTDTMQIIHDGATASRVEKTIAIAGWPDTHSRLRVCFQGARYDPQRKIFKNCGTCEKCVRTMIPLKAAGLLSNFSTFPVHLAVKNIQRIRFLSTSSRSFAIENLRFARHARRWDMVTVLSYVIVRGKLLEIIWRPLSLMLPERFKSWVKNRMT